MSKPLPKTGMIRGAAMNGIDMRNTVVMGSRVLGLNEDGRLFQWCGTRWVELVVNMIQPAPRGSHRRKGYAGHPTALASQTTRDPPRPQ